jgi:hypothetical protein
MDGPRSFIVSAAARAQKKREYFLSACRKRELCTESGDEKPFPMRCAANSIADKDGIFSDLLRDDQFVTAADADRFSIAH